MIIAFYIAAAVAIISTLMVITRTDAVHALLYLVVSLLAVAVLFYMLGAPFAAALEVIVYAGAIMVLFIFVVMMLHLGEESVQQEKSWLKTSMWIGPAALAIILFVELVFLLTQDASGTGTGVVEAREVGISLYGPYLIAVELAAILLMTGIVGAYHLGREEKRELHRFLKKEEHG